MDADLFLLDRFFAEAREILDGARAEFELSPESLIKIAAQPALRSEFSRRLKAINNDELRQLILDFLRDMVEVMDDAASEAERKVDLLDRAGMGVAASVTAAGIGTTVAASAAAGSLVGPLGLLVGGLLGLIATAWGRDRLKRSANRSKSWAGKFRRLIGKE